MKRAAVLYRQGLTCQQIADRYGLTRSYVSSRLRSAGETMRPASRPSDEHHLDPDVLIRLRHVGATWAELASIFRMTRYAVRRCYVQAAATHMAPVGLAGEPPRGRNEGPAPPRT